MANPKLTKVKKGVTVEDDFWVKNREKVRIADSVRQAEGLASTARVRARREEIEAQAEDEWSGDAESQTALKKKREMEKRRNAVNAADSLSRGGGM